MLKTLYDFENAFQDMMDKASKVLSPEHFEQLKDTISMILANEEESN